MAVIGLIVAAVSAAVSITQKEIKGKQARRQAYALDQDARLTAMQQEETLIAEAVATSQAKREQELAQLGFLIVALVILFLIVIFKIIF